MKVSVIIPSYKPKAYLWKCLDSLSTQTFSKKEFEIIIVLNGCFEPYEEQILSYIKNHQEMNLIFLKTTDAGVSNARNIALDQAKGEYVAFIDDDDFVSDDYLSELYNHASIDIVSVCYPYAFIDGYPDTPVDYSLTKAYDWCIEHNNLSLNSVARKFLSGPCMKLIHRDIINNRRFDVRFNNGEDSIFMFLISDRISSFSFTSKSAVYYRRYRENSAHNSLKSRPQIVRNELNIIKEYLNIYVKWPEDYSFVLLLTRVIGALRTMIIGH